MRSNSEAIVIDVIHDLRQPLSAIETSAFILHSLLSQAPPNVREHLRMIERQVAIASHVLIEAGASLSCSHAQRAGEENREFTKSATAVVT